MVLVVFLDRGSIKTDESKVFSVVRVCLGMGQALVGSAQYVLDCEPVLAAYGRPLASLFLPSLVRACT